MKLSARRRDRARIAAMLSGAVMPGAGQFYNGERVKGVLFGAIEILCLAVFVFLAVSYFSAYMARVTSLGEGQGVPVSPWAETFLGHWKILVVAYLANRIAAIADAYRAAQRLADVPKAQAVD